jgi:hypothetical protein
MAGWLMQVVGVTGGFNGALFLVVSQQAGAPMLGHLKDGRIESWVVLRYPRLWLTGLILLTVGFVVQLVGLF